MFAAVVAALAAALLSLGGASLVIADQPAGKGVDNQAGTGNGNAFGKTDEAPAAAAPQDQSAARSQGNATGHAQTKERGRSRSQAPKQHAPAVASPKPQGGGSHSTATAGPGNSSQGCDGTHNSDTGHGANQGGPYDNTCDGTASGNGNGGGQATGKPCAGCVGNADDKNPGFANSKGQMPNGSDHNAGYECDRNHGIGRSNPAHTGCTQTEASPPPANEQDTCPQLTSALSQAAMVALKAVAAAHPEIGKLSKLAEAKVGSDCGVQEEQSNNGNGHTPVTICHATGSATNPFVEITIDENGLNGHADHQDGRDINPAPAEGCPAGAAHSEQKPGVKTPQPEQAVQPQPGRQAVLGFRQSGTTPSQAPRTEVLGATAQGTAPAAAAAPAAAQRALPASDEGGSLPFTGTDALLVLFLGCLLLLGGVVIQRVLARN
jgi:hypothetical protein